MQTELLQEKQSAVSAVEQAVRLASQLEAAEEALASARADVAAAADSAANFEQNIIRLQEQVMGYCLLVAPCWHVSFTLVRHCVS